MIINFINCSGGGGSSSAITEELKGLIERSLTSITIPEGTTKIGVYAFDGCSGLTSVDIPDSVTKLETYTFNDCIGLTSVTIGSGVTTLPNNTFNNCKSLSSITVPDNVTTLGSFVFGDCSALAHITLPSGITDIGGYSFRNCKSLQSIILPEKINRIAGGCFSACALTSITIPSAVTSIEGQAFANNSGLTTITSYRITAPTLATNVFQNLPTGGTLNVPTGSDYSSWLAKLPSGWTVNYISKFTSMASYEDLVSHDYTFYKKNGSNTTAFGISFADSAVGALWYNPEGGITLDGTNYYAQYDSGQDKVVIMNNTTHQPATDEEVALFEQYLIVSSEKDYNGDVYIKTKIVGNLNFEQGGWATNPICGQYEDWYYNKEDEGAVKKVTDVNEIIQAGAFTIISGATTDLNTLFVGQQNLWVASSTKELMSNTPLGLFDYYLIYDTGATGNVELYDNNTHEPLTAEVRASIEEYTTFNAVLKNGIPQVTITYQAELDNWAQFDTNPYPGQGVIQNLFVPNN